MVNTKIKIVLFVSACIIGASLLGLFAYSASSKSTPYDDFTKSIIVQKPINSSLKQSMTSWIAYNGKNMTIVYIIPLKIGEIPLNTTKFSSIIIQAREENNRTLIQLQDQTVLQTNDKNIIAGKDSVVGTEQIYKSICDPNQLAFVFVNGTKLNQTNLEILSANSYFFKVFDNPYCQDGAKGLKILDFKIIH